MSRRFKPPWTAKRIPGGYVVKDATNQALAYVYARETKADADTAKVLTMDEAHRVACINVRYGSLADIPTSPRQAVERERMAERAIART